MSILFTSQLFFKFKLGNTWTPKPVATVSPQTILPVSKEITANFNLLDDDEDICIHAIDNIKKENIVIMII